MHSMMPRVAVGAGEVGDADGQQQARPREDEKLRPHRGAYYDYYQDYYSLL